MAKPNNNRKLVYDPLWGITDITDFLPMVDVPEFQALGFKRQLGVTAILFPAATYTRKESCLGAFKRTQDLSARWVAMGFIKPNEAHLMNAYALWHDIGHGPFSHVCEEVTRELWGRDHDQNGAMIIDRVKDAVETCGIPFVEYKKMFTRENPLYLGVFDKNLGSEKLDYLARDAFYTLGEVPGVEYLAHHTYFINGTIGVDEKAIDNAKAIQEFYVKMYKTVYLRKSSAIAQRMIQKMTVALLRVHPMTEEAFWALTDFELLGLFGTSDEPTVREWYWKFRSRHLPRTAIALVNQEFASLGHRKDKAQWVLPVTEEIMQQFVDAAWTPSQLEVLEHRIEEIAGLPERSVLIVPPTSIQRFRPQDITVFRGDGTTTMLSELYPEHFDALEAEGRAYATFRVCTFAEHREHLAEPEVAEAVRDFLARSARTHESDTNVKPNGHE